MRLLLGLEGPSLPKLGCCASGVILVAIVVKMLKN